MDLLVEKTVGEIVASNFKTADVFKKYGIDFCCGGNVTLSETCKRKGIDLSAVEQDLQKIADQKSESHDFDRWELDFLIDYIINQHHSYVAESIPLIIQYSDKVARVHGQNHPETVEINRLFHEVARELEAHMQKEEMILFPFIKQLVNAKKEGMPMPTPPFGTVQNPIRMMEMEHETAGDIFKQIDQLSNNYTPPLAACTTYRVLYAKLEEFETDLHKHIHLENNILFPKASTLESLS